MNRFFSIIFLFLFLLPANSAEAGIFGKKNIETNFVRDFDEVKLIEPVPKEFKSPDVPDVPQDNPILEGGAAVGNKSGSVDKEDVDLDAIDDELPENNSETLPSYDQDDLENKQGTSVLTNF